jgi:arginyl-tRNA synthetase
MVLKTLQNWLSKHYPDTPVDFNIPPDKKLGDLSSALPLVLAKKTNTASETIGQQILEKIIKDKPDFIKDVSYSAPGYINFHFDFAKLYQLILSPSVYQRTPGHKIVIEHTNINPNKAAHVGHLRNACLGDALGRILKKTGTEVEIQNYIDDTGVQVADVVLAHDKLKVKSQKLKDREFAELCWNLYAKIQKEYEEKPELLKKRQEIFKAIEEGKEPWTTKAKELSQKIVDAHLKTMARLGIFYDVLTFESIILKSGLWDETFKLLQEKNVIKKETSGKNDTPWAKAHGISFLAERSLHPCSKEQGITLGNKDCWILPGKDERDDKVLVKSDGTLTYTAKDLAYTLSSAKFGLAGPKFTYVRQAMQENNQPLWRQSESGEEKSFGQAEKIINVIDARQDYLQNILKKALQQLDYKKQAQNLIHYSYQVVALSPSAAQKLTKTKQDKQIIQMSGRLGIGVKADDLIDEAEKLTKNKQLASSAVKYYLLKFDKNNLITFDFDQALQTDGNTGVYLEYALVRAKHILDRIKNDELRITNKLAQLPQSLSLSEQNLIFQLSRWPDVLNDASQNLSPATLCQYAFELSQVFTNFYESTPLIYKTKNADEKMFRACLVQIFYNVLKDVLETLGLPVMKNV